MIAFCFSPFLAERKQHIFPGHKLHHQIKKQYFWFPVYASKHFWCSVLEIMAVERYNGTRWHKNLKKLTSTSPSRNRDSVLFQENEECV